MASEKQRVALISLGASAILAAGKLVAGLATGSLGILSEAVHSLLDVGATAITFIAVRYADQPADATHHFGHAKAESVAAFVETGLLFATTGWIVWEAVRRLQSGDTEVHLTWWAVAVVAVSVVVDYNRAAALRRTAASTSSEALEADALHFSSDMWSSIAVLIGLGAVWIGFPAADAAVAIVVAVFVFLAGLRLGRRTLNTLLDAAPTGVAERIAGIVRTTEGALALRRVRVRPSGSALFINVDINVRRTLPFDEVTEIKRRITDSIRDAFPRADVSITTHPVPLDNETTFDKVMLVARRRSLAIHHLTVQHIRGKTAVSFDLEVDGRMPLEQAHEIATELEGALADELGPEIEIDSHIEPAHVTGLEGEEATAAERATIEHWLRRFAAEIPHLSDIHNIRVRRNPHGLFVSHHARVPGDQSVETIHDAVDEMEDRLRKKLPEVRRVIAHAEPLGPSDRESKAVRKLVPADYRTLPWKNGGGTTTEIAVFPASAGLSETPFIWRISIAEVEKDGPFSAYPGYERIIMLVNGPGMVLDRGSTSPPIELKRPLEPKSFAGEEAVTARLVDGPCRDFNLMVRREDANGSLSVERLREPRKLVPPDGGWIVAYIVDGELREARKGETLIASRETSIAPLTGSVTVAMATITQNDRARTA
jgi:cation diffusion facilitator family transporter